MLTLASAMTDLAVEKLELFMLALVRVSFIVFLIPAFSHTNVPTMVKAALSFAITLLAFPLMPAVPFEIGNRPIFFLLIVLEQAVVGMVIGFSAAFVTYFISYAGEFMSRDIGIMQGGQNILTQEQVSPFTALLLPIFLVIFLASGAHLFFFQVIFESFQYIPMGHFAFDTRSFAGVFTILFASALVAGFKMAAPVIAVVFLCTVALGLMNRVMPQMQVWILGIPL
jgi:flagellar biosynthetic protein FliR